MSRLISEFDEVIGMGKTIAAKSGIEAVCVLNWKLLRVEVQGERERAYIIADGWVVYSGRDYDKATRLRDRYWPDACVSNHAPSGEELALWRMWNA